jgi:Tat protein secretion system quality control protein TatD with DNase activity
MTLPSASTHTLLSHQLYDAHCHFHLDSSDLGSASMNTMLSRLGGVALMSTRHEDWDQVIKFTRNTSQARCLLGIHPWFAHHYIGRLDWLNSLREKLQSTPYSALGEIGLDRKWRTPETGRVEYEAQLMLFHAQLKLAAELALPVSIHCVHSQGDLYDILNKADHLPPTIYLHAFGGAPGTAEQLIRSKRFGDRLYFGFAACINLRSHKTKAVIKVVPDDRLVIESDRSSTFPLGRIENELQKMLEVYKEVKGWSSIEQAAQITYMNASRLYRPADLVTR